MTDANAASFQAFLQGWMMRQRDFLNELISAQQHQNQLQDSDLRELISRVLYHYEQYYQEKSKIARKNILLVFSPPWFTPLERSFLWVAGLKPGMVFQIMNTALEDLTDEQKQRMEKLNHEIKLEERALNDELAKIQETVAAPPLVEMARSHGRLCWGNCLMAEEGEVPNTLTSKLENLVANADALRTNTALKVVGILRPAQSVKFLAAMAELLLRIGEWGLENDEQSGG